MLSRKAGIVIELQSDCLNQTVPSSQILRKAKAIASKLKLGDLEDWLTKELNGYNTSSSDLPDYRIAAGSPKFWNPYRGYCPIICNNPEIHEIITRVPIFQSVPELESIVSSSKDGELIYEYPPQIQEFLHESMSMRMKCSVHLNVAQIESVTHATRDRVLDWALKLESNGVVGSDFSFERSEIESAKAVTNNIYGSNIGFLGTVSGGISNSKVANVTGSIDFERIGQIAHEISDAVDGLPTEMRSSVRSGLTELTEAAKERSESRTASAVRSLRSVLENAGGGIVAQAALGLLPIL
ncbi:MAG: hypothetical protein ACK5SX_03745 [Sandaracinobacter sp.]